MDYEVFLISEILRTGCNEIESNIVNYRMCRMFFRNNRGFTAYQREVNSVKNEPSLKQM